MSVLEFASSQQSRMIARLKDLGAVQFLIEL